MRLGTGLLWLGGVVFLVAGAFELGRSLSGGIGLLCVGAMLLTIAGLETFVWSRRKTEKENEEDVG